MKKILIILAIYLFAIRAFAQTEVPVSTQAQLTWQNAELVAVFHYDLHVFDGEKYNQQKNRITPIADYNIFNPEKLNTDQWIKAIKDAGFNPSWGTYPFPYSHSTNQEVVLANNFQLLKEGDPNGDYYMSAMSDAPLRGYNGPHEWFWESGDEEHIFPLENLMNIYYKSVGHNTSLILGLTPNPDGLMPEPDVKRLKEWGDEIKRRFSNLLAAISGKGNQLKINLKDNQEINHIILQENIANGERVRKFVLKGKTSDGWQTIFEGSCIGYKFIHQFDNLKVSEVRLTVLESKGEPQIQKLEVFNVN
jgi:alpha-L-fucosidase